MSFIQFESGREKDRIREELRNVREELLKRAKKDAEVRAEKQARKTLSGEATWMLPDLAKKIDKLAKTEKKSKKTSKKRKKEKKFKKPKKLKKKSKRKSSSSSSDSESDSSSSTEEEISVKKRRKRKMSTESSSSDTSTNEDGWIEKTKEKYPVALARDDWMNSPLLLKTFSKNDNKPVKEKQNIDAYNPAKSTRELNPHWKDGGTGLPAFKKPSEDNDSAFVNNYFTNQRKPSGSWRKQKQPSEPVNKSRSPSPDNSFTNQTRPSGSWRKQQLASKPVKKSHSPSPSSSSASEEEEKIEEKQTPCSTSNFLTDQQMNELGAKIIKAEIIGNLELADELKKKLEAARTVREQTKNVQKQAFLKGKSQKFKDDGEEHVLLTTTDNKGSTRPLLHRAENENDRYGGRRGKQKNKKVETHVSGERVRYFPDDDKYDIKQMFEREKYTTAADSDLQFAEIAGKNKNPNDDLEDIFADKVRKNVAEHETAIKETQRAIYEHEKLSKKLDNCDKCFDSHKMQKQLMVSMGKNVYLALPWHEGLQPNHCLIVPMQHVACSTLLDEDTYEEISDYRRALTRMFAAHKQDVVFFETARYLHKRPHMVIHCVPANSMEMAPFYFKKAIQESEFEWSTNKQLVSLKDKSLRRAIPKGLPYFWVNFGMDSGFAHVIEDQERFPSNFAQEIIGGMLHLDPSKWRRPRKEHNFIPKVKNLADWWKPYDITE